MLGSNPDPVLLRRATLTDAETIAAITDAAYTKYVPAFGAGRSQ